MPANSGLRAIWSFHRNSTRTHRLRDAGSAAISILAICVSSSKVIALRGLDFPTPLSIEGSRSMEISRWPGAPEGASRPLADPLRPHIELDGVEVGILADKGGLGWGTDVKLTLDGLRYKHLEQTNIAPSRELGILNSIWHYTGVLLRVLVGRYQLRISEDREQWLKLQYERKRRRILSRFMIGRWLWGAVQVQDQPQNIPRTTLRASCQGAGRSGVE